MNSVGIFLTKKIIKSHIHALKAFHGYLAGNRGDNAVKREGGGKDNPHCRVAKGVGVIEEFQPWDVVKYFGDGDQQE